MKTIKAKFIGSMVIVALCIMLVISKTYNKTHSRIVVVTVPKSGSHLLTKTIGYIEGKEGVWLKAYKEPFDFQNFQYDPKKEYLWGHPWPHKQIMQEMNRKDIKGFVMIRHPGAIVVSSIDYAQRTHPEIAEGKSFDDLFTYYLQDPVHQRHTNLFLTSQFGPLSLAKRYEIFLNWTTLPNFLTVRFEDLVGSKGGGSDKKQRETIMAIANHLGKKLTTRKVEEIQKKLFGDTVTFREGQINGWKKHLNPSQCRLAQQHFARLLKRLNYEDIWVSA